MMLPKLKAKNIQVVEEYELFQSNCVFSSVSVARFSNSGYSPEKREAHLKNHHHV